MGWEGVTLPGSPEARPVTQSSIRNPVSRRQAFLHRERWRCPAPNDPQRLEPNLHCKKLRCPPAGYRSKMSRHVACTLWGCRIGVIVNMEPRHEISHMVAEPLWDRHLQQTKTTPTKCCNDKAYGS